MRPDEGGIDDQIFEVRIIAQLVVGAVVEALDRGTDAVSPPSHASRVTVLTTRRRDWRSGKVRSIPSPHSSDVAPIQRDRFILVHNE
jgi:hypothetical protein